MPCIALTPFPPIPPLPAGITIAPFAPPVLPPIALCCTFTLPQLPIPAVTLPIPFLPGAMTALSGYIKGVQATLNAMMPSCPLQ